MAKDPLDRYYTPQWVVDLAINHVLPTIDYTEPQSVLDPCCGKGIYLNTLLDRVSSIQDWLAIDVTPEYTKRPHFVTDFLLAPISNQYDLCLTNPPYKKAEEFARRCFLCCKVVVFLLRLNWLASKKRHAFFAEHKPSDVFVLPQRPSFETIDGEPDGTDATDYCYVAWDQRKELGAETKLHWLPLVKPVKKERKAK